MAIAVFPSPWFAPVAASVSTLVRDVRDALAGSGARQRREWEAHARPAAAAAAQPRALNAVSGVAPSAGGRAPAAERSTWGGPVRVAASQGRSPGSVRNPPSFAPEARVESPSARVAALPPAANTPCATPSSAGGRAAARARREAQAAARPLRVVRVVEPAHARSTAGRMVISGRLADVCAELDRLVALEAAGAR